MEPTTKQEVFYTTVDYKNDQYLVVTLERDNKYVKNVEIAVGLNNYKYRLSRSEWRGFSPDVLLEKYGQPFQVGLGLVFSPSDPNSPSEDIEYNLILNFKPVELTVEYELGLTKDGDVLDICPLTDTYQDIRIFFGKDPVELPSYVLSLENASSLTLEQFSDLMRQKSKPACFRIIKKDFIKSP